ncbi:MAG: TRAP transporter small permease subunit [Gammaproteobacteria bacterium]
MMTTLLTRLDRLTDLSGRLLSTLTLILTVILFITVLMRYGLKLNDLQIGDWRLPRQAMEESVMYLHCILFMLASAYTLRSDAHVRVDVFYRRFSPRTRAIIDLLGSLLFLLPMAGFILWSSLDYVEFSWRLKEKSQEAEGLPWLYLLKTLIPLMGGLLIWQGLIEILRNAVILAGRGTSSQQEGVR